MTAASAIADEVREALIARAPERWRRAAMAVNLVPAAQVVTTLEALRKERPTESREGMRLRLAAKHLVELIERRLARADPDADYLIEPLQEALEAVRPLEVKPEKRQPIRHVGREVLEAFFRANRGRPEGERIPCGLGEDGPVALAVQLLLGHAKYGLSQQTVAKELSKLRKVMG